MTSSNPSLRQTARRISADLRARKMRSRGVGRATLNALRTALEDSAKAGLLDGEPTQTLSLQVPLALIDAAQRESGVLALEDLGLVALALLAQPDPVANFLHDTRGKLGETHEF
jgi:hypothetical protein